MYTTTMASYARPEDPVWAAAERCGCTEKEMDALKEPIPWDVVTPVVRPPAIPFNPKTFTVVKPGIKLVLPTPPRDTVAPVAAKLGDNLHL
mgnify:CR=1 FL=1